jgi:hypothetical protein
MPILGVIASSTRQGQVIADIGAMFPLGMVQVGSGGAANISFTSIPSTYKHLQLRIFARTNRAATRDSIKLRLNSDSGANYAQHNLFGDGTSATAEGFPNEPEMALGSVSAATAGASMFGTIIVDILDYASTNKTTTVRSLGGNDGNGDGKINNQSNLWNNTAAVTSLYLEPYAGTTFNQYSSFALYGIKGA